MIAAILRAQFLTLRRAGAGRSGKVWLSVIPLLFFYGMWSLFAISAFAICSELAKGPQTIPALAGVLLGVFLYWQIAPVITASMGASLNLQKLAPYPLDPDKLFVVEVMLRLFTVSEMLLVLFGAWLGMAMNPRFGGWRAVPRLCLGALLFIAFNLLVAAGLRSFIENFFRRKRAREIGMLVFVLFAVLPSGLLATKLPFDRAIPYLPLQACFPWAALARVWTGLGTGGALLIQSAWVVLGYRFGRWQFFRTLRVDPYAGHTPRSRREAGASWADGLFRLPGRIWRDPLAAMVEKELRSLSRSAGFRLTFVMGFTFGLLVFLPTALRREGHLSFMNQHYLTWVSLYSLMLLGAYTFWNSFGYDRSAAQFYFAAPVSFRQVLFAKNITASIAQALECLLIMLMFLIFTLRFDWFSFSEAVSVTCVACLYLFCLGNLTSVRLATAMNPEKMSQGSGSRAKTMVSFLVLPIGFLPIGLAYWGRYVFASSLVFFGLLFVAAAIGCVMYWIGLDSAVAMSITRREQMIASLSRGDGPLSIT